MNKKRNKIWRKLFDVSITIPTILSLIALGFSYYSHQDSRKMTLMVSGMEYSISQTLLQQELRLENSLYSIGETIRETDSADFDFSHEIDFLSELQISSEYGDILQLIDASDVFKFKKNVKLLALKAGKYSINELKTLVDETIDIIIKNSLNDRVIEHQEKKKEEILNGKVVNNQTAQVQQRQEMVNQSDLAKANDTIQLPTYNLESFLLFVDYEINERQIEDPDMLFFYGIMNDDTDLVIQAINAGANENITVPELVARYSDEYLKYTKEINHKNENVNNNENWKNVWEFIKQNFISIIVVIFSIGWSVSVLIGYYKKKKLKAYILQEENYIKSLTNEIEQIIQQYSGLEEEKEKKMRSVVFDDDLTKLSAGETIKRILFGDFQYELYRRIRETDTIGSKWMFLFKTDYYMAIRDFDNQVEKLKKDLERLKEIFTKSKVQKLLEGPHKEKEDTVQADVVFTQK